MADFGKTGKVTIREDAVGVEVDVNGGQYLSYQLTAQGSGPIFKWACEHKLRLRQSDFAGHPKQTYEWTWSRQNSAEGDSDDDIYTLEMRFSSAIKYTLVVELRDNSDQPIKTVKDVDFESQTPEDWFGSTLRIFRN